MTRITRALLFVAETLSDIIYYHWLCSFGCLMWVLMSLSTSLKDLDVLPFTNLFRTSQRCLFSCWVLPLLMLKSISDSYLGSCYSICLMNYASSFKEDGLNVLCWYAIICLHRNLHSNLMPHVTIFGLCFELFSNGPPPDSLKISFPNDFVLQVFTQRLQIVKRKVRTIVRSSGPLLALHLIMHRCV